MNEKEDLPVQALGAMETTNAQKLGASDTAIIFWRRRMPWKSRDAQRLWGKSKADQAAQVIEQDEVREESEIPLV